MIALSDKQRPRHAAWRPCERLCQSGILLAVLSGILCATDVLAQDASARLTMAMEGVDSHPDGAALPSLTLRVDGPPDQVQKFNETATITGLALRDSGQLQFRSTVIEGRFQAGVLTITPELAGADYVSVAGSEIVVATRTESWTLPFTHYSAWFRLFPPLLAIGLAIALKDVYSALLLATFGGCLIFHQFTDFASAVNLLCQVLVDQVADPDHASIILFTVLLGAMIGLMNDSGGTRAVVERLSTFADNRRKGQVLTWLMGLIVFFDDYANTMLIGGAMRPLSDKLRISREKLAFLIDTTAAPIAGLALVSTWVGFEIDQVATGLKTVGIANPENSVATSIFLSTIPYRIYPIAALVMVGAVAITGRDYGPMLKAEREAAQRPVATATSEQMATLGSMHFAVWPILTLVGLVVVCYVNGIDSYRLLIIASLVASVVAFLLPLMARKFTFEACSKSWSAGIASMIPAITVLVLAWAVSDVCRPEKLDTAGFIISLVGDSARPEFLPAIAFLVSGAVAVSIGSSFTTMALLIPLFIPLSVSLLSGDSVSSFDVYHPVFLGTTGAILAGAIFGDHCSPISDTTVLSSAAAGCDHLKHVATQLPYAIVTAAFSLLLGYLPIGFGLPWWIAMPLSAAACAGMLILLGKATGATGEQIQKGQAET